MIDLQSFARRFGLPLDGNAIVCGLARITTWEATGELCVSTSDGPTADLLYRSNLGRCIYRKPSWGYTTIIISERRIGQLIELLTPEDEALPSYGRRRA